MSAVYPWQLATYDPINTEFCRFQRIRLKHIKAEEERHTDPANILLTAEKKAIEEFLGEAH